MMPVFHYHILCLDSNRDFTSRFIVGTDADEWEALRQAIENLGQTEPSLTVVSVVPITEELAKQTGLIE